MKTSARIIIVSYLLVIFVYSFFFPPVNIKSLNGIMVANNFKPFYATLHIADIDWGEIFDWAKPLDDKPHEWTAEDFEKPMKPLPPKSQRLVSTVDIPKYIIYFIAITALFSALYILTMSTSKKV